MARKPSGPPPKSAKRTTPVPAKAAAMPGAAATQARADAPKKRAPTPVQFALQVREEGRKIAWTSWRETWVTSVMVFFMVFFVAVFFLLVDQVLGFGATALLRFAS